MTTEEILLTSCQNGDLTLTALMLAKSEATRSAMIDLVGFYGLKSFAKFLPKTPKSIGKDQ
jgi:hypothetical protein